MRFEFPQAPADIIAEAQDETDMIDAMPKEMRVALIHKCASMADKLGRREDALREVADPKASEEDLFIASLTERLALFEMLIEAASAKLEDLENRLGGKKGKN